MYMLSYLQLSYFLTIGAAAGGSQTIGSSCPYLDINDKQVEYSSCDAPAVTRGIICTIKACEHCPSTRKSGSCISISNDDGSNCYLVIRKYYTWANAKRYCDDISGKLFDPSENDKVTDTMLFYIAEHERNCKKVWIAEQQKYKNWCEQVGLCSQICKDTKTGYECRCKPGYSVDSANGHVCRADGDNPYLLATTSSQMCKINLRNYSESYVNLGDTSFKFDYDHAEGRLIRLEKDGNILSAPLSKPDHTKTIKIDGWGSCTLSFLSGLAFDWINKNIYWTNPCKQTVNVIHYTGIVEKTLVQYYEETCALVVNPVSGYMYVIVGQGIERVGMDGTDRTAIKNSGVSQGSLAYDYVKDKLYWIDNDRRILSCDGDGNKIRAIISRGMFFYIGWITLFEDSLYFPAFTLTSNQDRAIVYSASKFNGSSLKELSIKTQPWPMKAYHKMCQPQAPNRCRHHPCSQLCLASPIQPPKGKGYTCACSSEYLLDEFGTGCLKFAGNVSSAKKPIIPSTMLKHNNVFANEEQSTEGKVVPSRAGETANMEVIQPLAVIMFILASSILLVWAVKGRRYWLWRLLRIKRN